MATADAWAATPYERLCRGAAQRIPDTPLILLGHKRAVIVEKTAMTPDQLPAGLPMDDKIEAWRHGLLRLVLQHARAYADNSDPAKTEQPTSLSVTTSAQRQKGLVLMPTRSDVARDGRRSGFENEKGISNWTMILDANHDRRITGERRPKGAEQMLTDEQCNEFRRLPMSFNDMGRAIYEAGRAIESRRVCRRTA